MTNYTVSDLLTWARTFAFPLPAKTVEDVNDGILFSKILREIDPDFFSSFFEQLHENSKNKPELKANNLRHVLASLKEYNAEVLGKTYGQLQSLDVDALAEKSDEQVCTRFLQMLLVCAVNSPSKDIIVQRIMSLDELVQVAIKEAIQELLNCEEDVTACYDVSDVDSSLVASLRKEVDTLRGRNELLEQQCHDLNVNIAMLQEEKCNLQHEVGKSMEGRTLSVISSDESSELKVVSLQQELSTVQEDLYRIDLAREDYRLRAESAENRLLEIQGFQEELQRKEEENRRLKDELDILRERSQHASRIEAAMESLRLRNEELSVTKQKAKALSRQNTALFAARVEMEEEVKKARSLRAQLEASQRDVEKMSARVERECRRAETSEGEASRLRETVESLRSELERLHLERNRLRDMNEEMTINNSASLNVHNMPLSPSSEISGIDMLDISPAIREKVIRLQVEVENLRTSLAYSERENEISMKRHEKCSYVSGSSIQSDEVNFAGNGGVDDVVGRNDVKDGEEITDALRARDNKIACYKELLSRSCALITQLDPRRSLANMSLQEAIQKSKKQLNNLELKKQLEETALAKAWKKLQERLEQDDECEKSFLRGQRDAHSVSLASSVYQDNVKGLNEDESIVTKTVSN